MKKLLMILPLLVILFPVFSLPAQAQSYAIPWWTVDGGGGTSSGGGYTLSGTIGQPDAGVMSGGDYTLTGGFWGWDALHMIYLPLILRN
jgi:hypothetical protein